MVIRRLSLTGSSALLWVLASLLTGCGLVNSSLDKSPNAVAEAAAVSTEGAGGDPTTAFQTGLYTFAQQNCVQCHGSSQSPLFAVSNVTNAYNAALPYVDFSNPGSSTIVQYAGNGHCGLGNCSGSTQSSSALADVNVWAAAVNAANTPAPTPTDPGSSTSTVTLTTPSAAIMWTTAPMPIPSNIPTAGTKFAVMHWPLSSLSPTNVNVSSKDVFEVQIQLLTPQIYRITMPRFASTSALTVAGVHVMIKPSGQSGIGGEFPLGLDWNSINTSVTVSTIPSPVPTKSLTGATLLSPDSIPMPVLSNSDELTIGFESIQPTTE